MLSVKFLLPIGFCVFPYLTAHADTLKEISAFAKEMCDEVRPQGKISRDELAAKLKGELSGIAKLIGGSVSADGTIRVGDTEYQGLPYENISEQMIDSRTCKVELGTLLIKERSKLQTGDGIPPPPPIILDEFPLAGMAIKCEAPRLIGPQVRTAWQEYFGNLSVTNVYRPLAAWGVVQHRIMHVALSEGVNGTEYRCQSSDGRKYAITPLGYMDLAGKRCRSYRVSDTAQQISEESKTQKAACLDISGSWESL